MKILMATMALDIGGAETHIVELSRELVRQGHQVVIVSNGGVYVEVLREAGIRHINAPLNRRSLTDMRQSLAVLDRVIREERPDIVHAHARIPGFLCGLLRRRLRFAFVTSCHGVYEVTGPLRLLSNWGQRTLAVSQDIKDYLVREYSLPPEHITVTINGIDTERFSPAVSGDEVRRELGLGEGPILLHVCRLDSFTAPTARQLIRVAPALGQTIPGLQIVIAGGGEVYDELRQEADKVNEKMGRKCLLLTGPRTDIHRLLAACDIFVGVSRAALEAMSSGRPVVLSGAQGHIGLLTPEVLDRAAETNFCCRTDAAASDQRLLFDLRTALDLSAEERTRLGDFGRRVVRENYSVHRMAEDCLGVYRQVFHRYRVVVSGYYGFGNAGDDAILEAIRDELCGGDSEVALTVLSRNPAQTESCYGTEAVQRFRTVRVLNALRKCDALLSGGGSLLQDNTSTRSLLYYLSVIRWAQRMRKPVMLYANGIGPVTRPENRERVRRVVEKADVITLRDHGSARELEDMGIPASRLTVTADPVFLLNPACRERAEKILEAAGIEKGKPFAAVSVRDWPNTEEFLKNLAVLCDHLSCRYGLAVLLLPMQRERDMEPCVRVRREMEEPSFLLEENCTPRELMAVLGESRLCLAMRLHTLIFAARMAVPSLGLVYDPKVESYLRELGLPSAGSVERFDSGEAIRRTDELMADYDDVLVRLREKSSELSAAAEENKRLLLEMLRASKKKK